MGLFLLTQTREPTTASVNPTPGDCKYEWWRTDEPRVGTMVDVAMAIDGKADESRAAAAHGGCCCVRCVVGCDRDFFR